MWSPESWGSDKSGYRTRMARQMQRAVLAGRALEREEGLTGSLSGLSGLLCLLCLHALFGMSTKFALFVLKYGADVKMHQPHASRATRQYTLKLTMDRSKHTPTNSGSFLSIYTHSINLETHIFKTSGTISKAEMTFLPCPAAWGNENLKCQVRANRLIHPV